MHVEPELVADARCIVGEAPLWHARERCLYWVDAPRCRLYRYAPATGAHELAYQGPEGEYLSSFTIQADGALLLFTAHVAVRLWRAGATAPPPVVIDAPPETRGWFLNDTIADPRGRVFGGTLPLSIFSGGATGGPRQPGKQYRLDPDGSLRVVIDAVRTPNGMGFTPDGRGLYFTDSGARSIVRYDYDAATGGLGNRRAFVETAPDQGVPDGMTVDAEGCVWSARWGASCVVRYSPAGRELGRIAFPAKFVASCTFGGDDYGDLYVTTAVSPFANKDERPGAGGLYRLRPGVRGVPEFVSRVGAPGQ